MPFLYVPMDQKPFFDQWLIALRSGQIKQVRDALCNGRGMCCLGVMSHIVNPFGWTLASDREYRRHMDRSIMPRVEVRSAMFGRDDYEADNFIRKLAMMNDAGCTFAQIADYIENRVRFIPEGN